MTLTTWIINEFKKNSVNDSLWTGGLSSTTLGHFVLSQFLLVSGLLTRNPRGSRSLRARRWLTPQTSHEDKTWPVPKHQFKYVIMTFGWTTKTLEVKCSQFWLKVTTWDLFNIGITGIPMLAQQTARNAQVKIATLHFLFTSCTKLIQFCQEQTDCPQL